MREKEIKERLLKENKEFLKAYKQHQKLERQLSRFQTKSFLTEEEKVEEKRLKIQKLKLKDKMYHMMTEYRKHLP